MAPSEPKKNKRPLMERQRTRQSVTMQNSRWEFGDPRKGQPLARERKGTTTRRLRSAVERAGDRGKYGHQWTDANSQSMQKARDQKSGDTGLGQPSRRSRAEAARAGWLTRRRNTGGGK